MLIILTACLIYPGTYIQAKPQEILFLAESKTSKKFKFDTFLVGYCVSIRGQFEPDGTLSWQDFVTSLFIKFALCAFFMILHTCAIKEKQSFASL